ncbi:MAG: phage holin family protein [Deltaproteobacteria bacterium]|jgi:expansin (peptidoglycan-binding protein)|nr:phage holin family protein [Deltaproteobacteria bacterium]
MDNIKSFIEALILPLGLGVFGGIARACKTGFQTWRQFFSSVTVSAFTGVVVHLAIQDSSFSATMQAAVVAASGYSGGAILDGLIERVTANIRPKQDNENGI